jgi:hypothetical protein
MISPPVFTLEPGGVSLIYGRRPKNALSSSSRIFADVVGSGLQ